MKLIISSIGLLCCLVVGTSFGKESGDSAAANNKVVAASEINWQPLNPARGDKSPRAGVLWGGLGSEQPTGFLVEFVDGFSSPPHIHNVTYRAVVIDGLIHNDDPAAAHQWMPAGSFWTQPKGEVHITAARGTHNLALVEIDHGPYLVLPLSDAYDSGERPVNIDASNIVWVSPAGLGATANEAKIAYLWGQLGEGQENGTFIKLPADFSGHIVSHGSTFRAVIIKGALAYRSTSDDVLDTGSYFSSSGEFTHTLSSTPEGETIIYVRTNGEYELVAD